MKIEITVTVVRYADRKYLMMRYLDPTTGKQIARSTGTTNRRQAERTAAKWEAELREGRYAPTSSCTWDDFRDRYENEALPSFAKNTSNLIGTSFNALERLINPRYLRDLTAEKLSTFQARLRSEKLSEHTIRSYLAHLRSSLSWAKSTGLISQIPEITFPKRAKKLKVMKGRPLNDEEFKLMLDATPEVVGPVACFYWQQLLRGLWLSGLRLSEALHLSWDRDDEIRVNLSSRRPMLHIPAQLEKGNEDRLHPISPEFAGFLLDSLPADRTGHVFSLSDSNGAKRVFEVDWVSRIISKIGKKAGIIVGQSARTGKPKFASAHDLRRSFGDRWARLIMPQTLRELMRHASIETTLRYYVGQNAEKTADILWSVYNEKQP